MKFKSVSRRNPAKVWRQFSRPFSGVYLIKCLKTNKVYVKYSLTDTELALKNTILKLTANVHPNQAFQDDWNKYGTNNFAITFKSKKFIPLKAPLKQVTDIDRRITIERSYNRQIDLYKNKKLLYNNPKFKIHIV